MTQISIAPATGTLEVPMDMWTEPFWQASAQGRLRMPRCGDCGRFRWPPGPFCPACQSQAVDWVDPGPAIIYSYTVVPEAPDTEGRAPRFTVPALAEFPQADDVRLLAAIVGARREALRIGAPLAIGWVDAAGGVKVPIFHLA